VTGVQTCALPIFQTISTQVKLAKLKENEAKLRFY